MSNNQQQQSSAGESNAAAGTSTTSADDASNAKVRAVTEPLLRPMEELYDQVIKLVETRKTKTPAELAMQAAAIKATLVSIRHRVRAAPGLSKSPQHLQAKVDDLKRQICVQDEFFESFKTRTRATDRTATVADDSADMASFRSAQQEYLTY